MEDTDVKYRNFIGKFQRKDLFEDLWELRGKY
jgi:hypothetical protein